MWLGGVALASVSAGECLTPLLLSGEPIAGMGVGGAIALRAYSVGNFADGVGVLWSVYQLTQHRGRVGDVAVSVLEFAWAYPGSGTAKLWIADPYLTVHGEPSP